VREARGREAIGGWQIFWLPLVARFPIGSSSSAMLLRSCLRHEIGQGGTKKIALPPRGTRTTRRSSWGLVGLVFSSRASFFPLLIYSSFVGWWGANGPPAVAGLCSSS
jgi:hypothetical protein